MRVFATVPSISLLSSSNPICPFFGIHEAEKTVLPFETVHLMVKNGMGLKFLISWSRFATSDKVGVCTLPTAIRVLSPDNAFLSVNALVKFIPRSQSALLLPKAASFMPSYLLFGSILVRLFRMEAESCADTKKRWTVFLYLKCSRISSTKS